MFVAFLVMIGFPLTIGYLYADKSYVCPVHLR